MQTNITLINSIRIILIFIFCSLNLLANEKWAEPQNISFINSYYDDFAPCWNKYQNKLYFNSTKEGYAFYYTSNFEDGIFSIPEKLKGQLNLEKNNQAYITFESEEVAYISTFEQYSRQSLMNIFASYFKKNEWTKPILLNNLATESFTGQATISPDNQFMIFVSNNGSEQGDTDFWISYKESNGNWAEATPINVLNTSGNELTPFLATNDTLYFASNGWGGLGGYDIFYSVFFNGTWQKPYPLTDLNTEFDESDLTILPNGYAVFSSNRPGGLAGFDLYLTKRNTNEKSIQKNYEFEISIAAQSTTVSYSIEKSKAALPIIPFINYDPSFPDIFNVNIKSEIFSSNHIQVNSPEEIDERNGLIFSSFHLQVNSLKEIAERMVSNSGTNLTFEGYFEKNKQIIIEEFLNNLINNLSKKYNISKDRFNYTFKENKGLADIILIQSNSKELFEQYYLIDKKFEYFPSILNITVNVRPLDNIPFVDCNFLVNDRIISSTSSNSFPFEYDIDLNHLAFDVSEVDSAIIRASVTDKFSNTSSKDFVISIFEQQVREKNYTIKQDGKEYLVFPILLRESNLSVINHYESYFNTIKENNLIYKKVLISISKEIAANQKKQLIQLLSTNLNISEKNIEFSKQKIKNQLEDNEDSELFNLLIMIEK